MDDAAAASTRRWASPPRTSRTRFGITREDAGRVRATSQKKAKAALEKKVFDDGDRPGARAYRYDGNGEARLRGFKRRRAAAPRHHARGPRAAASPRSRKAAAVTAGNSSPLSDGAAAALVMSARQGERARHQAARLSSARSSPSGVDPAIMGIGPLPAVQKLLAKTGLKIERHRRVRDQRGVREPGGLLHARARHPRREAERQRRRDRARSPARLHRRQAHRDARSTSCSVAAVATRIVTMCIGGGQGAAGLFERA